MAELAVVIPIYNVERYLRRCVESVAGQTRPAAEIILVDDGSTDGSGAVADALARTCETVRVIHQSNGGVSAARNTGMEAAAAEYITFVDSDDYIAPDMYETLLGQMEAEGADIAIGGVWYEQEDGARHAPYPPHVYRVWDTDEAMVELNSYRYFNMSFCNKIFRRSLFEGRESGERACERGALRFPEGKLCEDYYLMYQILARAERIVYTSQPLYHYVQRAGSIARNKTVNTAQIDASLEQLAFYSRWFPDISYVAETACEFSYLGVYSDYLRYGQRCPGALYREIRKVSRQYLGATLRNPHIPRLKKVQALTFLWAPPVYRAVIRRTKHR